MSSKEIFILLSLLILTTAQGEDTCKAKVVVMGREELAEEITAQIAATTLLSIPGSVKPREAKSETCVTYENVTSIVKNEMDKLASKIETLCGESIQPPISTSLVDCAACKNVTVEISELYNKVESLIQPIAEKLALLEKPGHFPSHPASSCKEINKLEPNSPSGYYWLRSSNGTAVRKFCDMTCNCGGVIGGWMKVAKLDMTNITHQCSVWQGYRISVCFN